MPLVYVQRYAPRIVLSVGTQVIESGGEFELTGYVEFELDPTVYTQAATYVLIDYSLGSFTKPVEYATGQAALSALATVDLTGTGFTNYVLTDDAANKQITVTVS